MIDTNQESLVVIRHGELFLKGANRRSFEDQLRNNIKYALHAYKPIRLEKAQGRFFLHCQKRHLKKILNDLRWLFGISSYSRAHKVSNDIEEIKEKSLELALFYKDLHAPKTFRVSAKRTDKRFPLTSPEINRAVGDHLYDKLNLDVNLKSADLNIGIEIGSATSFIYVEKTRGGGGLPVGSGGKLTLLLSGGIDSPVAGHLLQKRGCRLNAVYFHAPPHTSERAKDKVLQLANLLAKRQGRLSLFIVNFTKIQETIAKQCPLVFAVVLYRRAMMYIAGALGAKEDSKGLLTGENLGQVASQTIENLTCIEDAADYPVLRPLIAFDKQEIISIANDIKSYDISILPHEDTCSLFIPKHPATRAPLNKVQQAENDYPYKELWEEAINSAERIIV